MTRKDFRYEAKSNGYLLFYHSQPIGGVGIEGRYAGRDWLKQVKEYAAQAEDEIADLIAGRGRERYLASIARIDAQESRKKKSVGGAE